MARSQPLDELSPERVCIIKPSALGDVVQALPVLSALRRRWPAAHFAWVIRSALADLLHGQPDLDEVIEFRRVGSAWRKATSYLTLLRRLSRSRFDLTLDLQGLMRSGIMTRATRSPRRVGFRSAREGAKWAYTDRIAVDWHGNLGADCYWRMAQALGCGGVRPPLRLGLTDEHRDRAKSLVSHLPRPLLLIHPGAQWATKRWPVSHYAALARQAQQSLQAGIVLVGGQREIGLCKEIERELDADHVVNAAGQTPLLSLSALILRGDVFLSGDTGPMHLAAGLGTRTVSVYTCTSSIRSGPYGNVGECVSTSVPCAASYLKKCNSMICMRELTPTRVWPALERALSEQARTVCSA